MVNKPVLGYACLVSYFSIDGNSKWENDTWVDSFSLWEPTMEALCESLFQCFTEIFEANVVNGDVSKITTIPNVASLPSDEERRKLQEFMEEPNLLQRFFLLKTLIIDDDFFHSKPSNDSPSPYHVRYNDFFKRVVFSDFCRCYNDFIDVRILAKETFLKVAKKHEGQQDKFLRTFQEESNKRVEAEKRAKKERDYKKYLELKERFEN